MSSILRKAMLPAAVAIAMLGFIGAFGSGAVPSAQALDGDICRVDIGSAAGELNATPNFDGQGNDVYVLTDATYGAVFRMESDDLFEMDNVTVTTDAETGAGLIFSSAEILDIENDGDGDDVISVGHDTFAGVNFKVVDSIDPDTDDDEPQYFGDSDGNPVDGINGWLMEEAGMDGFTTDDISPCSGDDEDLWGFVDFRCTESGYFHLTVETPEDTEESSWTGKFFCPGQADDAELKVPGTLETDPTNVGPGTFGEGDVVVTVYDQHGARFDGAVVHLSTDNCHFDEADDDDFFSPAGGGAQAIEIRSDTDPAPSDDADFLSNNPLQHSAGTAEAILDCTGSDGAAGVANIQARVERDGADIILDDQTIVVGATTDTGLELTLTPEELDCGETILAVVTAVDSEGQPVSDGTVIFLTTDTSSGVIGGTEGAQGEAATDDGEAVFHVATDPGNPGTHTVIAYTKDSAERVLSQDSKTYHCEGEVAPAPPAPTVEPPPAGTGSISPPSTGDAGLASSAGVSLFAIAGVVVAILGGIVALRPRGI